MVKLSVIETEKPQESLIIGRGTKDFAYRFRPYSRWPRGPQFKVFTTIAETQISVDECRVNDEGEVIFRVNGDVKDAKAFIKDWIEREGWKVESNPLTVTKDVIAKSEREAIASAETETGGKTVYVEKIGEEKIDATLQLWRVTLEVPGVERVHHSDMSENPFVEVRFLTTVPAYTGLNGTRWTQEQIEEAKLVGVVPEIRWSPYEKGHVYALPKANADFYVKMGQAEYVRKEAVKPTLKELFTGATLESYLEAARVKPLLAEEMEKSAIEKWRLRSKAEELVKEIREEKTKHG